MSPHKLYPNSQLFTEHLPWARHWVRCGLGTDKEVTWQGDKHFVSLEDRANCLGSLCFSHVLSDSTNPSLCKDFDEIYPQLGTSGAHLGMSPESSQGIVPPAFATVVCLPSLPKATTSWTLIPWSPLAGHLPADVHLGASVDVLTHHSVLAVFVCSLSCTEGTGEAQVRRSRMERTLWTVVISSK